MSRGKGNNQGKGNKPTGDGGDLPNPSRGLAVRIAQPFTIRQESTADDHKQYSEERESRNAHLRAAQRLNIITIAAGFVALASLGALFLSIRQSRQTFEMGQRAWVLVDRLYIGGDENAAKDFSTTAPAHIVFIIKNSGLSPALHVTSETGVVMTGDACSNAITVRSPYNSTSTIAPGAFETYPNYGTGPLTPQCMAALRDGTSTFSIRGTIQYNDIFGRAHKTKVCVTYEGMASRNLTACNEDDDETN